EANGTFGAYLWGQGTLKVNGTFDPAGHNLSMDTRGTGLTLGLDLSSATTVESAGRRIYLDGNGSNNAFEIMPKAAAALPQVHFIYGSPARKLGGTGATITMVPLEGDVAASVDLIDQTLYLTAVSYN